MTTKSLLVLPEPENPRYGLVLVRDLGLYRVALKHLLSITIAFPGSVGITEGIEFSHLTAGRLAFKTHALPCECAR